jgi:hypothetical protein
MAAGDAQRAWFPEMTEELERFWTGQVDWDQMIAFCARMTEVRRGIRQSRGIRPPMTTCPKCGRTARSQLPDVSPRSALFALRKAGVLTDEQMKQLEREWTRHRKAHALDAYGKMLESRQSP